MTDFATEFMDKLQTELGASERDAKRIAEHAVQYRNDFEFDDTPAELIDRMRKREPDGAVEKWNSVVGFLYGEGYSTQKDGGKDNPYLL